MNDSKYTRNLILGEESGLKYFISKFGRSLRYFAYSITHDKEISEEIVSDAFYKLWQGREKIKTEQSIKSYLYIVTRNACFDHVEKFKNKIYVEEDVLKDMQAVDADFLTKIIYSELLEMIAIEITKLPHQQAEIFRMAYLEGLTPDEISIKLGTSINNVYFAKSSALKTLKKVFKQKNLTYYFALLHLSQEYL